MATNNESVERCMECDDTINTKTYAIYRSKNNSSRSNDPEEIVGYLCEKCRSKHKIKPVRNVNELEKLIKLKDSLK
jgi:uncharacterized protein YlaI